MDPNFLLKDELEYELESRGVGLQGTVPILKRVLKELMLASPSGAHAPDVKVRQVKSELDICATKLNILSNYITEIVGKPDKALFRRLVSRLYHVQGRLSLLKHAVEDEGLRKDALEQQCQALLEKLEEQDDEVEEEQLTAQDKDILQQTLGDLGNRIIEKLEGKIGLAEAGSGPREEGKGTVREVNDRADKSVNFVTGHWLDQKLENRPRLLRTSTVEEKLPKRKLVPIYQWGLKFSGSNMSINAFLERVLELRDARNATDLDLWRYAIDFFEADALVWFRANKGYASNWEDIVILLKRAFQKPFYQEELLAEIRERRQGRDETVLIYVAVMQNMFNRLPAKITEREKLNILLRNIQPYYQRAVCRDHFDSVADMTDVLRVVERTKVSCDKFEEPRTLKDPLEPDLAHRATHTPGKETLEVEAVAALQSKTEGVVKRCWNCRESGHLFRDCKMPKQRLFCYKCGRFGSTSKDCHCKENYLGESPKPAK